MKRLAILILQAALAACSTEEISNGAGAFLTGYGRALSEQGEEPDQELRQIELNQRLNQFRQEQWQMQQDFRQQREDARERMAQYGVPVY
jgi:hypothetical protein